MADRIPLFEIRWDERDVVNAVRSIGRGSHWAKGPFVDRFERRLAEYFDVEHALTVNSGTSALVAALESVGVGPGDEVIVPSFTFVATANAVRLVDAEPVFCDVERSSYGLDPDAVRSRVTPETAAIVPVHLYGGPCQIDELATIADDHDLALVEDAAEAFGATYDGKPCGTFGDVGALSFCQNKILPTGEGGAVLTDDDAVADRVQRHRSHGRADGEYFDSVSSGTYRSLGGNLRMSDLTAAVGCAQLDKIEELIEARQAAAAAMNEELADVDGVRTPTPIEDGTHVYQLYTLTFDQSIDRATVIEVLDEHAISSKIYWDTPVHRTVAYEDDDSPDLPRTDRLAESVLSVPIYPDLTPAQADRIVSAVSDGVAAAR